ncbi:protein of unknown function DUF583 [Solidesulfovibrio carbinoliphilus subsp. oakridgensis]|uniref:Uncharacterized protein n=1 Tax=Solidesulfovibrio carbinoliphilus subsp. oakridgensis TaxID=694327 RepID=G7Q8V5_9BACT|nr:protein of unknown function DUF583 [Solidesulfovibrio carbinoliphilus]EHJ47441.1 protein of unknown function DUF583 [Solidesulfovibrio carbinoliphilus subsp. oakridgensis]
MQPYTKGLVVQKLLRELKRSSAGASLLWAIAALVVVGGLGAAVAVMSPSTVQSKLEQEAAMRAYYNANSGLNFIYSIERTSEAGGVPYANFLNAVNSGNVVTYPLADGGEFSFQINSLNTDGNNGNYAIDSLVGTVDDSSGGKRYSYVIYGGGKGSSTNKPYVPVKTQSGASKYVLFSQNQDVSVAGAATITGSIYSKSFTIEQTTLDGDIVSQGDVKLNYNSKIKGNTCAKKSVYLAQSSVVKGDVNAQDSVYMDTGCSVEGSVNAINNIILGTPVDIDGSKRSGCCYVIGKDLNAGGYIVTADQTVIGKVSEKTSDGKVIDIYYPSSVRADGRIRIWEHTKLGSETMPGTVYSSGQLDIGQQCNIFGNVYSNAAANVEQDTTVYGDLYLGGKLFIKSCPFKVSGVVSSLGIDATSCRNSSGNSFGRISGVTSFSLLAPNLPSPCVNEEGIKITSFSAGSASPNINKKPILPDKYGALKPNQNSSLYFTHGNYYFTSIEYAYAVKWYFDVSQGDINIFVVNDASINDRIDGGGGVFVSTDGSSYNPMLSVDKKFAANIYLEAHGNIDLQWGSNWFGTLMTTKSFSAGGKNTIIGQYATTGNGAAISWSANIDYVPSHYAMNNW